MNTYRKTCIILLMCLCLFMPDFVSSKEGKSDLKNIPSDKAPAVTTPGKKYLTLNPQTQKEFSINLIRPNPSIDNEIVKNMFDMNIDYELRIINPCTKKEITGCKGPYFGPFQYKHQPPCTDEKYSMRVIRPNPNIDPEIVRNNFDPNIEYKLRIINPYTKKETTGYKGPYFGSLQNKFKLKGKIYETPIISPLK